MKTKSRRSFLRKSTVLLVGGFTAWQSVLRNAAADSRTTGQIARTNSDAFVLPSLPYAYNALEPFIDEQTMRIHHDRHHRTYVDQLNKVLDKAPEWKGKNLEQLLSQLSAIPETVRTAVRNHGGGHWNHTFFWNIMMPSGGPLPTGKLLDALQARWTSYAAFQTAFTEAAMSVFGSGWCWLIADKNQKLSIVTTPNQDNPIMDIAAIKGKPVLGIDLWEHAYYLKHQNRRAEYIKDWWQVVNWPKVALLYESE